MKKKLQCFFVCALFLAAMAGGALLHAQMPQAPSAASALHKPLSAEEYAEADPAQLAYYGLEPFETTLPVIFIDTKNHRVTKENASWASIAVLEASADGTPRSIDALPDYVAPITIKYRGASSYSNFDKNQYRIKFYKKEGGSNAKNYNFLGMGANSEWVLNGPFLDKTLLRNRLIYGIARQITPWAPDSRYVEVFVDGAYQGLYLAVEPVTNGEARLRLSEFGLLSGETAYIVKRERVESEGDPLQVYGKTAGKTSNDLFVHYPSDTKLTQAQWDWIERDISAFERVLYSDSFADPETGYARYIDVDCFVDYVVLNEFVMNNDAGNLSTYVYKELGGKLQIAVWDFNNAFDNYQWFMQDFSAFFMQEAAWFSRLLQDRAFVDRVIARYNELRQDVLSTQSLYARIDACRAEMGDAAERNFAVWGYTFSQNLLTGTGRDLTSYDAALLQLKQAIDTRTQFLDTSFSNLYTHCIN